MSKYIYSHESFVNKAIIIHGLGRYEYIKPKQTLYNSREKLDIFCPIGDHNIFKQSPNDHLQGKGCQKCGRSKILNKDLNLFIHAILEMNNIK